MWSSFLSFEQKFDSDITLHNLKDKVQNELSESGFEIPYDTTDYIDPIPLMPAIMNRLFLDTQPLEFSVNLDKIVEFLSSDCNIKMIGLLKVK